MISRTFRLQVLILFFLTCSTICVYQNLVTYIISHIKKSLAGCVDVKLLCHRASINAATLRMMSFYVARW